MDVAIQRQGGVQPDASSSTGAAIVAPATLKRRASCNFDHSDDSSRRKRLKEDVGDHEETPNEDENPPLDGQALVSDLEQELECGCCSALVYRPVVVSPCQHFFCGSCIVLWVKNGGTNCPACRAMALAATPSRPLQIMADLFARHVPSRARSVNERMQADEIYKAGMALRIPSPRVASPEPAIPQGNTNLVQPCPHCIPGNQWGWRCPQPIPDPVDDPDNAWNAEDGTPPGHAFCGNCESLLSLQAPTTSRCDFCQVSFCGVNIPARCVAAPLHSQYPHNLSDLSDLIQCSELYDCFNQNTVEVDYMIDYLTAQGITPRHIYREIVNMISRTPRGFTPLIEAELFTDVHAVAGGVDPDPTAPRNKICRVCASEVLLWGLRDWWVQERKKGFLEEEVTKRPDCPDGPTCNVQKTYAHAREFNHIIAANNRRDGDHSSTSTSTSSLPLHSQSLDAAQGPSHQPPVPIPHEQIPRILSGELQMGSNEPGLVLPPYHHRTIIYADFTPSVSPEPEPQYPPMMDHHHRPRSPPLPPPSRILAESGLHHHYHIPPALDPREAVVEPAAMVAAAPSASSPSSSPTYMKRLDEVILGGSQGVPSSSTTTTRETLAQVAVAIAPRHPRHSILDLLQPTDIPVQTTGMVSLPSSQDQVDALL